MVPVSVALPKKIFEESSLQLWFEETGFRPTMKPIDLDMSDWSRLCNSYVRIIKENPSLTRYKATVGEPSIQGIFDDQDLISPSRIIGA